MLGVVFANLLDDALGVTVFLDLVVVCVGYYDVVKRAALSFPERLHNVFEPPHYE